MYKFALFEQAELFFYYYEQTCKFAYDGSVLSEFSVRHIPKFSMTSWITVKVRYLYCVDN